MGKPKHAKNTLQEKYTMSFMLMNDMKSFQEKYKNSVVINKKKIDITTQKILSGRVI